MVAALRVLTRVLLALAFATGAAAQQPAAADQSVPVELHQFSTLDAGMRLDRILSGDFDAQFLPAGADSVRLPGGSYTHWIKFTAKLPEGAAGDWILAVGRVPLDRIVLYLPQAGSVPQQRLRRFFQPGAEEGLVFGDFAFSLPGLPGSEVAVYAAVHARAPVWLSAELVQAPAFHRAQRSATSLAAAVYAALLVLALGSLSLGVALHDRAYLFYVGFTASLLLLLGMANGHAYAVPGVSVLAWWGPLGIAAVSLVCCAMAVGLVQRFIALGSFAPRAERIATVLRWSLLALAVLCLANVQGLLAELYRFAALAWIATAAGAVGLSALAWRGGQPVARAFCLMWVLIGVAATLRALLALGLLEPQFWTLRGYQVVLVTGAFLLSIGLADRVWEFRKQRDRARLAKEQTDASLQIEQRRRELVDGLREALKQAPPGDLEWIAFRKLLATLRQLVPQSASAVIAYGYHDLDLLLSEPSRDKERFSQLMAARGGNIKGICRGRTPLQVKLAPGSEGAQDLAGVFAIVPLAVAKPGWGAVVVERQEWEEFDAAELKLIGEFAQLTTSAADESASHADLRRRADLDALTGAFNRRAGDVALEEMLASALDRRLPLSVLLVDIDHFRQINDRHDAPTADECLRQVAEAIRRQLQPGDFLARWGGEEFLVLLPGRQPDQARQLAERMREGVAQITVKNRNGVVKMTVSIGVAGRAGADETPQPLLERVEKALYTAKRNGRNQVAVAPSYGGGYGTAADSEPPEGLVL
jgi:diguanylate cyclase (GGDEF)-like protein